MADEAAWAAAIAERLAVELLRDVSLPPIKEGEPFAAFITRAIVNNPDVADPARACRGFGIDVLVPSIFCPAVLASEPFKRIHLALAGLRSDPASIIGPSPFDSLWSAHFPLSLRMAIEPRVTVGPPAVLTPIHPDAARRLLVLRLACRRRDALAVELCERLRSGALVADAFHADDPTRAEHPIPCGWWGDAAVECSWQAGELRPIDGAARGTPHYRGLRLRACVGDGAALSVSVAVQEDRPRRRPPVSYADDDRLLIARMREMITTGTARNPNDAALVLAGQARGRGTLDSRRKRLLSVYAMEYGQNVKVVSTDHSGRD